MNGILPVISVHERGILIIPREFTLIYKIIYPLLFKFKFFYRNVIIFYLIRFNEYPLILRIVRSAKIPRHVFFIILNVFLLKTHLLRDLFIRIARTLRSPVMIGAVVQLLLLMSV